MYHSLNQSKPETNETKAFVGHLKRLRFLLIVYILKGNEASSPVLSSPNTNSRHHGFQNNGYGQRSDSPSPFTAYRNNNNPHSSSGQNSIGSAAPAAVGISPFQNRQAPTSAIRSKRLRNPLDIARGYPSGRIDAVPGIGDTPRTKYIPPTPPPKTNIGVQRKSAFPGKPIQPPPAANRIRPPYIGDGYSDSSNQGNALPSSRQPVRIDSAPGRQPVRIDSAPGRQPARIDSAPGRQPVRIDSAAGRQPVRIDSAPGRQPVRIDSAPGRQAGRFDIPGSSTKNFPPPPNPNTRVDRVGERHSPHSPPPSRHNPNTNPNSNRNPNPFGNGRPRFPTGGDSRAPPGFTFDKPISGGPPDYTQRYNQPEKRLSPASNSSFDAPGSVDFVPLETNTSPSLTRNPKSALAFPGNPFQSSGFLGGNKDFQFPAATAFNHRSPRQRPARGFSPKNLFQDFPSPMSTDGPDVPYKLPVDGSKSQGFPNDLNKGNYQDSFKYDPRGGLSNGVQQPQQQQRQNQQQQQRQHQQQQRQHQQQQQQQQPAYGTSNTNNNNRYPDRSSCFQYSFPAEAYRLSELAKDYPKEEIQAEIDMNPHLSPMVGLDAKAVSNNDPFTFNAPIASHFDFSGFGFGEEATTSDKYSHLKNDKALPGNMQEGDLTGRYPSTMQPLDKACPSQEFSLRSYFHQGSDCYVINPDFQQVNYHRCTRQDCSFCGVNRGLSACVEEYRWVTAVAYCAAKPENKRISPMRLFLPVGCSCQHFVC